MHGAYTKTYAAQIRAAIGDIVMVEREEDVSREAQTLMFSPRSDQYPVSSVFTPRDPNYA